MSDTVAQASAPLLSSAAVIEKLRAGRDAKTRAVWRRVPGMFVFLVLFARELVLANIAMAKVVLFQNPKSLKPEFFIYDLTGLGPAEIVILTHCISLTPGTTSVEVSEDETRVLVHGLDVTNPDAICLGIKNSLEKPLLGWTR
jgi:multisubunit Na+/H+ antiporter MnhE subunit